jgi:Domain of unknown function (DUF222)
MTPARLLDEIAACERRVRAVQARQLQLIAQFAAAQRDGLARGECEQTERAIGMEVAAAIGASIATARAWVGDADTLTGRLPAVLEALAQGRIGLFAARQCAAAAEAVHRGLLTPDVDHALAEEAAQLLPGQVKAAADARVAALDADAAARRADEARARRDVWVMPKPDGVATLGATLPAEQAVACWQALDSHARGRRADGDDRPIAQIMCDTLVERVTGATRAEAPAGVELQVVITDQTLLGASDSPATLAGYGSIPADTALKLSAEAQAWVRRLLTDPLTGSVTDADRRRRRFTGALRDLIRIRDRRCLPGRLAPAAPAPARQTRQREVHSGCPRAPSRQPELTSRCESCRGGETNRAPETLDPPRASTGPTLETRPTAHSPARTRRPYHSLAPPALGHGTPTLEQLRHRRALLEPEGPSG